TACKECHRMNEKLLARIPLFGGLDAAELKSLASLLKERSVGANEPIFWIGDTGDDLYIVESGRVQVGYPDETGKETVLAVLEPGAFFGDISLLDGGPRSASTRTLEPTVLLSLSRSDFLEFLRHHPGACINVLTVLGNRQRETIQKLR